MDRIIKTVLTTLLIGELLLLIAIIGCAFGTLDLANIPFIGYIMSAREVVIFGIVRITINTAMILHVSNHILEWIDGEKIADKFISVGKASLLASVVVFLGELIASRLILGDYLFSFSFLGYFGIYVFCLALLESVGPVFCPITPYQLLLNWVTYEDEENEKEM